MRILLIGILTILSLHTKAQYPPAAGLPGSTAVFADSSLIFSWAQNCTVDRGWVNFSDTSLGKASFGSDTDAIGKADNGVVSLGDGGIATLTFTNPVFNGSGPDFCVFENAFVDDFLELAFVEVSSNGTDYFRFPSQSLTQTDSQTTGFGTTQAVLLHNLAGKYKGMFGTPFDLDEIENNALLDKNHITSIRIIDVVGSVNPEFATYDSQNRIINDPWPTPFNTCGFDLDAVGIIHQTASIAENANLSSIPLFFPNPANDLITLYQPLTEYSVEIYQTTGKLISKFELTQSNPSVNISELSPGLYFVRLTSNNQTFTQPLIRQ